MVALAELVCAQKLPKVKTDTFFCALNCRQGSIKDWNVSNPRQDLIAMLQRNIVYLALRFFPFGNIAVVNSQEDALQGIKFWIQCSYNGSTDFVKPNSSSDVIDINSGISKIGWNNINEYVLGHGLLESVFWIKKTYIFKKICNTKGSLGNI